MAATLLLHDPQLLILVRIAERRAQEEAVELRLGQRERALLLDRVLGRDQEKRRRQPPRRAIHRDLMLGHRLEQRRLRLRHRTIDLIDEQDVREDRARPELELPLARIPDRETRHIGRLDVRRALHAARVSALDGPRDRTRQHRLCGARHVLEQHVSAARERRQDDADLLALADHDGLDVGHEPFDDRDRVCDTCRTVRGHRMRRGLHGGLP
jgi:hypothetical protein